MKKKIYVSACLSAIITLLFSHQTALAHESIAVGDYEIKIGWLSEPPVAGQMNGFEISVSNTSSGAAQPVEDISSLVVTVTYGGQSKQLTLEPAGDDAPGQYEVSMLPTVAGQYTVAFSGQLGDTPVDAHAEPEEVSPADTIQFPSVESSDQSDNAGATNWLIYLSLLIGLIALGLGVSALRKTG
ncbi:MAG: hypothetical protein M3R47_09665 [Chloroflexota bacterium]|nr:hypothetical protein [Chloroflexota bacterium]